MNYDSIEERIISALHRHLESYGLPNDEEITDIANSITEWYDIEDDEEWSDLMADIRGIIKDELKQDI